MFLKLVKIFIKSKIILRSPPKKKIIMFDDSGSRHLKKILNMKETCLLPVRIETINEIYFYLPILAKTLKFLLSHKLSTSYFCAIIETINPKLVITMIDNSILFSDVARILDKKHKFIAVQNAARYEFDEFGKQHAKRFYIPEFACFGDFEKNLYNRHNIKVKKFFVCGSLHLAFFQEYLKKLSRKKKTNNYKKYDICLVSEASPGWDKLFPGFEKSITKIAEFTTRLAKKHNLKIAFVAKRPRRPKSQFIFKKSVFSNKPIILTQIWKFIAPGLYKNEKRAFIREKEGHKREINFYKKYIKVNCKIIQRNFKTYSSYQTMMNSNLTIAMMSTLLRENLVLGGKILSCNFTNKKIWNFPIQGICSFNNLSFDKFEKRVLKLLSISHRSYILNLKKNPKYLIYYSKNNSTQDLLKKKIKSFMV